MDILPSRASKGKALSFLLKQVRRRSSWKDGPHPGGGSAGLERLPLSEGTAV